MAVEAVGVAEFFSRGGRGKYWQGSEKTESDGKDDRRYAKDLAHNRGNIRGEGIKSLAYFG